MAKMASKQSTLSNFLILPSQTESLEPLTKRPRVDVQNEVEHHELSCVPENKDQESDNEIQEDSVNELQEQSEDESDREEANEEESGSEMYHDSYCKRNCCLVTNSEPFHLVDTITNDTRKKYGKQNRSVQKKWFSDYKWLTYCTTRNSLFCLYCRRKNISGGFSFGTKFKDAFVMSGFTNWKKGPQRFKEHEKSQAHKEAIFTHEMSSRPTITSMVNSAVKKDQESRRKMLLKQLSSLKYLLRQGLAIRGHSNNKEGNLDQLLQLRKEDISELDGYLKANKYLSPEIINEQIQLMANRLLRSLLDDIKANHCGQTLFAIIADETRDISGIEQLSISIRWVDQNYAIYEDFVGMVSIESANASNLRSVILDCLLRCNLPLSGCCGQAYDGAAAMSGHLTGVATQIKAMEPKAISIHCLAHSLNLGLQECASQSVPIREGLSAAMELHNLIKLSPKRLAVFQHMQEESTSTNLPSIKPLCPTRWTVRTSAVDSVLKNYSVLQEALEKIGEDASTSDARAKAVGLGTCLEQFRTYFGLKLCHLVFSATEQLSSTLQSKTITAEVSIQARDATMAYLQRHRSEDAFKNFYDSLIKEAEDKTDEPKLPRHRRIPKRVDDGVSNHQHRTAKDYYRQQYFEVLDILLGEIEKRLNQTSLGILNEIEDVLLSASNGVLKQVPKRIEELYSSVIDSEKFVRQLSMFQDFIQASKPTQGIRNITKITTICEIMNSSDLGKSMFTEVHKLLTIYLTVPMTSATAERTFSSLRRLKNYLRSTMTQKRLNSVLLLHVHQDRTDKLNLNSIAADFISNNERRKNYYGHN